MPHSRRSQLSRTLGVAFAALLSVMLLGCTQEPEGPLFNLPLAQSQPLPPAPTDPLETSEPARPAEEVTPGRPDELAPGEIWVRRKNDEVELYYHPRDDRSDFSIEIRADGEVVIDGRKLAPAPQRPIAEAPEAGGPEAGAPPEPEAQPEAGLQPESEPELVEEHPLLVEEPEPEVEEPEREVEEPAPQAEWVTVEAEERPAPAPRHPDLATLHEYVPAEIGSLDPAQGNDTYSNTALSQVYETLYEYHYLKRPYTLQPCLAAGMPEISEDGRTFTIALQQGIVFADNECFPGEKGRELVAEDFLVAWKRFADRETRTPGWWIFDGKIVGLNEYRENTQEPEFRERWEAEVGRPNGHWWAPVEGLQALDDHTLQITLVEPFPQFSYFLAMPYTAPIPVEALDHYGERIASNPVGTGPYVLDSFDGNSRVIYTANPSYREVYYPKEGTEEDLEAGRLEDAGLRLPLTDRVEIHVVVEPLPAWLKFSGGELDRYAPTHEHFDQIVSPSKDGLTSRFRAIGMTLDVYSDLDVTYTAFNMDDPLIGGNVNLRRAMSLAYDAAENIRVLRNGRGIPAYSPIPPGIFGFEEDRGSPYRMPDDMRAALAKAEEMMARAGHPNGKDLPPLRYASTSGSNSRAFNEQFAACMKKIGIELDIQMMSWPEFDGMIRGKRGQIWGVAWLADYPDPENFLQLLYGPNQSPGPNGANYQNPRFDELYAQMVALPNGPAREEVIREMVDIVQKDCPWIFGVHRRAFVVKQGWFRNYKRSSVGGNFFRYYRVDTERKRDLLQRMKDQ